MTVPNRDVELDPRFRRVREKLLRASTELAARKPIDEVSVAELSTAAGVHRTSFYSHAASPVGLLADSFKAELGPALAEQRKSLTDAEVSFAAYWRDFYTLVLTHVQDHRDIYRNAVASDSALLPALHNFFTDQVAESLGLMVHWWRGINPSKLWLNLAAQQVSSNTMALVVAWANLGFAPTIRELLEEYRTLVPPWQLARRDPDGTVNMTRRAAPLYADPS